MGGSFNLKYRSSLARKVNSGFRNYILTLEVGSNHGSNLFAWAK